MTSYAVYQPHLGWPLYVLHRAVWADKFVLLDDVELSKAGLNRITVPTPQGHTQITMPLCKAGSSSIIREVQPVDLGLWVAKATKTLQNLYGKCGGWREEKPYWENHWEGAWSVRPDDWTLDRIANHVLTYLMDRTDHTSTVVHLASELVPRDSIDCPSERLAQMGSVLKADSYVTGLTAYREYLAFPPFHERGIRIDVQAWKMTPYQSLHGEQTDPTISALDLLFSQGKEKLREVLGLPAS